MGNSQRKRPSVSKTSKTISPSVFQAQKVLIVRPIGHIDFDSFPGPGLEIMAIDSDVERLTERRESAVTMPEEMPGIKMAFVPDPEAVVAKDDKISFDYDIHEISRMDKTAGEFFLRFLVMSPFDQDDIAVEPFQDRSPVSPREISKVINKISFPDLGIPFIDEGRVHLCHVGKWAPAGMNDIGMIEMRVSRKENVSQSVILLREREAISANTPLRTDGVVTLNG